MTTAFQKAIAAIDAENVQDPNQEIYQSKSIPKEFLYSDRMYKRLLDFEPNASEEVQIAAKAQHICRWKIARETYPMDRVGYLKWREELKKFHAQTTATILEKSGYNQDFIVRVSFLIEKKLLKKDAETQLLEDVICLVFLEFYFDDFVQKHDTEKLKNIIQKTWNKMSEKGHEVALKINFNPKNLELIKESLGL
jgi:5-methylthioribose kinase